MTNLEKLKEMFPDLPFNLLSCYGNCKNKDNCYWDSFWCKEYEYEGEKKK